MPEGSGWQPLSGPGGRVGRDRFLVAPFTRLARVHAVSSAGDAMVVIALAGSLFFSIDPTQARWRVALYLVLTLAPFAVVAPLIGPAIDRAKGGSKWVLVCTCISRALVAMLMVRHVSTLWLFPEAFTMLVMAKGFQVAKSSYVPATVSGDAELVSANSKLAILSGLASALGGIPAVVVSKLAGAGWTMALATLTFIAATAFSVRLPANLRREPAVPAVDNQDESLPGSRTEEAVPGAGVDNRPSVVFLNASAMGLIRAMAGFLTFLLAFAIRASGSGTTAYGVVVAASVVGGLTGSAVAPRLRLRISEERILTGGLILPALGALFGALFGGVMGAIVVAASVAVSGSASKLAFDALVQRDVAVADKGRMFGELEARFQIFWVIGAFIPVVIPVPARIGFLGLAVVSTLGAVSYRLGVRPSELARQMRARANAAKLRAADLKGPGEGLP